MFDESWEKNIYGKGLQVNKYPYGELVSIYFNALQYLQTESRNLLELGCGAGNNLWFFAEQGWQVYGIDGSQSAVELAQNRLCERELQANIQQAYFQALPFADGSMDMVIDRESLYCGTKESINQSLQEVARVLKKGGVFISFRFSEKNPSLALLENGILSGVKLEDNTWQDVASGTFSGTGIVHFTTLDELLNSHNTFLDIKFVNEHTSRTMIDYTNKNECFYSEYILVGVRK